MRKILFALAFLPLLVLGQSRWSAFITSGDSVTTISDGIYLMTLDTVGVDDNDILGFYTIDARYFNVSGDSISGVLNFTAPTELTISSNSVTATKTYHTIDTESDAASDTLSTISGGTEGDIIIFNPINSTRTVVLTEAGNLILSGTSFSMDDSYDMVTLIYTSASKWVEISRSDNN